jgi:PPOX class probable F420-dependent enzyme
MSEVPIAAGSPTGRSFGKGLARPARVGAGSVRGVDAPTWVVEALGSARVARLGTADAAGAVRMVPVCFAVVGDRVVSAVDHKPKRTGQLRRLEDARASGRATLLVDHYDDVDWTQLWWVRVRGPAVVLAAGTDDADAAVDALVARYPQYAERRPAGDVLAITVDELRWWRWASSP